jgi:hypothetical protein
LGRNSDGSSSCPNQLKHYPFLRNYNEVFL